MYTRMIFFQRMPSNGHHDLSSQSGLVPQSALTDYQNLPLITATAYSSHSLITRPQQPALFGGAAPVTTTTNDSNHHRSSSASSSSNTNQQHHSSQEPYRAPSSVLVAARNSFSSPESTTNAARVSTPIYNEDVRQVEQEVINCG